MSKLKEATDLVDLLFTEGFEIFGKFLKAEKRLQKLLDTMDFGTGSLDTTGRPYDQPEKVRIKTTVKEFDGQYGEDDDNIDDDDLNNDLDNDLDSEYEFGSGTAEDPNDIEHVPNQDADSLYTSVRKQLGEWKRLNEDAKAEYKALFDSMLKKYGVSSPSELDPEKKKEFFDKIDQSWKGEKEKEEISEGVLDKIKQRRCNHLILKIKTSMDLVRKASADYKSCVEKKHTLRCEQFKKIAEKENLFIKKYKEQMKIVCKGEKEKE